MEIKIVRVLIPQAIVEDCPEVDSWRIPAISRLCDWGNRGDNLVSEPLCTLEHRYNEIVEFAKPLKIEILDITVDYAFYATTADPRYDYTGFGTLHIANLAGRERLVAIPRERAETYQVPRYQSGCHYSRKIQ